MNDQVEVKSSSWRPVRIIALIVAIAWLNSIENNPEYVSPYTTPADASATSGLVVYGSAILGVWLFIEIILGVRNLVRHRTPR